MKKYLFRLAALGAPLAAFLVLATPAFAQAVVFEPQQSYDLPTGNPVDIVRGDFDLDGDLDLATVNASCGAAACVTIFQGDGNGNYSTTPTPLPALPDSATGPTSIDRGDFNGDGDPDIVVTDIATDSVYVFLNTNSTHGTISFEAPIPISLGSGTNPTDVAVGNFNGDGRDDLAVANQGSNTVAILISNGSTGFTSSTVPLPAGSLPTAVDSADFDGVDGMDVVVANQGTNNAMLLTNNGAGSFTVGATVPVGDAPSDIIAGDFNTDTNKDFATANVNSDNVSIALGNGSGTFQTPTPFPPAQTSQAPGAGGNTLYSELAHGDYNCDGNRDIAVSSPEDNIVQVLTGNGNGTFNGPAPFKVGTTPSGLTTDDFDEEDGPDLATSNFGSNNISVLLNASPDCGGANNSSLNLEKTATPDPVIVGQNLTYTLILANNGATVSDVTITDTLPAGVTFVSATSGCTPNSNTVTCTLVSLNNNASVTEQIVVTVNQAGTLTNSATATSPSVPTPATDTITTTAQTSNNNGGNNRHRHNNRNNGLFDRFFDNLSNGFDDDGIEGTVTDDQYPNEDTTGNAESTTGNGTGDGVSATAGQDGTSADTGGTSADTGESPDTLPPVSEPQGDVVDEIDTGGLPLPPTGGPPMGRLASLAVLALVPLIGIGLVATRLSVRWVRRRGR